MYSETDDVSPIQGVSIACAAEESPPQAAASRSTEAVESGMFRPRSKTVRCRADLDFGVRVQGEWSSSKK